MMIRFISEAPQGNQTTSTITIDQISRIILKQENKMTSCVFNLGSDYMNKYFKVFVPNIKHNAH